MRKYILLMAVIFLASGCNNDPAILSLSQLKTTDLNSAILKQYENDLLMFSSTPNKFGSNLLLRNAKGDTAFLPKDYYYVPTSVYEEVKPANVPETLLVRKGNELAIFNTKTSGIKNIPGISIPDWVEVRALYSVTGGQSMLVALVQKDLLGSEKHSSLLYKLNFKDFTSDNITNPFKDEPDPIYGMRTLIAGGIYDAVNNRVIRFIEEDLYKQVGLESWEFSGSKNTKIKFKDPSRVYLVGQYMTIKSFTSTKSSVGILDLSKAKLESKAYSINISEKNEVKPFYYYYYIGENRLIGLTIEINNAMRIGVFAETKDGFSPIHVIKAPYTFLKKTGGELYFIMSEGAGKTKGIGTYDLNTNEFTGMVSAPVNTSSGEIEFLK